MQESDHTFTQAPSPIRNRKAGNSAQRVLTGAPKYSNKHKFKKKIPMEFPALSTAVAMAKNTTPDKIRILTAYP